MLRVPAASALRDDVSRRSDPETGRIDRIDLHFVETIVNGTRE
jgi:hypothetical protein